MHLQKVVVLHSLEKVYVLSSHSKNVEGLNGSTQRLWEDEQNHRTIQML